MHFLLYLKINLEDKKKTANFIIFIVGNKMQENIIIILRIIYIYMNNYQIKIHQYGLLIQLIQIKRINQIK